MTSNYYLDESGNSGDLATKKSGSKFGGQPIFSLACVGLNDLAHANEFIKLLKTIYGLESDELKSEDLYFKQPEVILDVAKYIFENRIPIIVEVVDKRYCVSTAIVGHQIIPPYDSPPDDDGLIQAVRNEISDFLSFNMSPACYAAFYKSCMEPSEENLLESMEALKCFLESDDGAFEYSKFAVDNINETIDTYLMFKRQFGEGDSVKKFIPLPDDSNNGDSIALLPHIHCQFNILARLNKYHLKDLADVVMHHDVQDQFGQSIRSCIRTLKNAKFPGGVPEVLTADFILKDEPAFRFVKSEESLGVQFADLLAGFVSRYINGCFYKNLDVLDTYHKTFRYIVSYNRPMSPLGVNFVLPPSKQALVFKKFNL